MQIKQNIQKFNAALEESLVDNTFVKISLGNYKGDEPQLKKILIKRVLIKKQEKLNFVFRYQTRDITKNYAIKEGLSTIQDALDGNFRVATLFTTEFDLIFENINNKKFSLKKKKNTNTTTPSLDHNHTKSRLVTTIGKPYFHELKITDEAGNVFKKAQDKYRQINRYVELLSPLIKDLPKGKLKKVVDMGSGKGYLTFALYDYLNTVLEQKAEVVGVEFRPDLVNLCNEIAEKSNFKDLHFEQGTIEGFDTADTDMLIALHACDTATDDAIYKGITADADLIVVAPCCHKQIRREIEKHKTQNDVDFLTKYGIFLERQAEMVTDGIRAMILEYFGYKTKVFEFISDAHTPKNVMIIGVKNKNLPLKDEQLLQKIKATKKYFGIEYHHLERMMKIE